MPQRRNCDFVALSEASVLVYRQIMGRPPQADRSAAGVILCDVAHALANVAPIFATNGEPDQVMPLDAAEVAFGRFLNDGTTLRTARAEYTGLCIRRSDVNSAIAVLLGARVRFTK